MSDPPATDESRNHPHNNLTTRCIANTSDDDSDPDYCDTLLTYEEHYVGLVNAPREREMEEAIKFRCPECGGYSYLCPICADSKTPGWFRGETTGELIPCHNCNIQEVRRERRGY